MGYLVNIQCAQARLNGIATELEANEMLETLIDNDNNLGLWAQQLAAIRRFWSMLTRGTLPAGQMQNA